MEQKSLFEDNEELRAWADSRRVGITERDWCLLDQLMISCLVHMTYSTCPAWTERCFIDLFYLFFFQVPKWPEAFTLQLTVTLKCCAPLMCRHKSQISLDVKYFHLFHTKNTVKKKKKKSAIFRELVIWLRTEKWCQRRLKKVFWEYAIQAPVET